MTHCCGEEGAGSRRAPTSGARARNRLVNGGEFDLPGDRDACSAEGGLGDEGITFLAAMSGCRTGSSSNQTVVNRPTPTLTEEKPTATPGNPSAAFAGEWETNDPRASGGGFIRWKFTDGIKKDNGYTGKVTDVGNNNQDIYNYTVTEKTITLEDLPTSSGSSKTYDYKITDEGKTITLSGDKPMVLRKGTSNAEMERSAGIISKHEWNLDSAVATKMGLAPDTFIEFEPAQKNDRGYGGAMKFIDANTGFPQSDLAQYVITSKENVIITLKSGQKAGTYKILNDEKILQIDFNDPVESDLFLNRR